MELEDLGQKKKTAFACHKVGMKLFLFIMGIKPFNRYYDFHDCCVLNCVILAGKRELSVQCGVC